MHLQTLVLIIFSMFSVVVHAQQPDIFSAYNIVVDATSASAEEARYNALEAGSRTAAQQILARLTPLSAHHKIPQVMRTFSSEEWVAGYEIFNERRTSFSYYALIDAHLEPGAIKMALIKNGIHFGQKWGARTLLIPVMESKKDEDEKSNLWLSAWSSIPETLGLLRLALPLGDLTDLRVMWEPNKSNLYYEDFSRLLNHYYCTEVVIVKASNTAKLLSVEYTQLTPTKTINKKATYTQKYDQPLTELYEKAVLDIVMKMDSALKGEHLW